MSNASLRNRRSGHEIPLILAAIVLILVNIALVNLLATRTFKSELNCDFLIDRPMNSKEISLCKGVTSQIGAIEFLRPLEIGPITISEDTKIGPVTIPGVKYGPWAIPGLKLGPWTIPILPALAKIINPPLDSLRPLIAWGIILFLALISLLLTYLGSKITGFILLLRTPEGVKTVLTNLSIWLLFFVSFCGLFYIGAVLR
jgi:hypothetical protein